MPEARIYLPENPLAKTVESRFGPRIQDLVANADMRVLARKKAIEAFVAEKVEALIVHRLDDDDTLRRNFATIHQHAVEMSEVAGAAGLDSIGAVATGIVAMAEARGQRNLWHPAALRLHIDALALLMTGADDISQAQAALLLQLRLLREAIGLLE